LARLGRSAANLGYKAAASSEAQDYDENLLSYVRKRTDYGAAEQYDYQAGLDATLDKEISNENHQTRSITAGRHCNWMHQCTACASRFDVRFAELFRCQLR
jgi:hypothetical protein